MKLDYIADINAYGDHVVRLYDFDFSSAEAFRVTINDIILLNKKPLDLSTLNFIDARNCNLVLCLSDEDKGIMTSDNKNFVCELTINSYIQMVSLIVPFCKKNTKGHQWLYDVDTEIDLLFSPAGTW